MSIQSREDDVPQSSGKITEKFIERFTDVRLREAERKDETRPRHGPRNYSRGLLGQPQQIIKTLLGQGDLAHFTVDDIIETLRNHGYGDTLEEKGLGGAGQLFRHDRSKTTSSVR